MLPSSNINTVILLLATVITAANVAVEKLLIAKWLMVACVLSKLRLMITVKCNISIPHKLLFSAVNVSHFSC